MSVVVVRNGKNRVLWRRDFKRVSDLIDAAVAKFKEQDGCSCKYLLLTPFDPVEHAKLLKAKKTKSSPEVERAEEETVWVPFNPNTFVASLRLPTRARMRLVRSCEWDVPQCPEEKREGTAKRDAEEGKVPPENSDETTTSTQSSDETSQLSSGNGASATTEQPQATQEGDNTRRSSDGNDKTVDADMLVDVFVVCDSFPERMAQVMQQLSLCDSKTSQKPLRACCLPGCPATASQCLNLDSDSFTEPSPSDSKSQQQHPQSTVHRSDLVLLRTTARPQDSLWDVLGRMERQSRLSLAGTQHALSLRGQIGIPERNVVDMGMFQMTVNVPGLLKPRLRLIPPSMVVSVACGERICNPDGCSGMRQLHALLPRVVGRLAKKQLQKGLKLPKLPAWSGDAVLKSTSIGKCLPVWSFLGGHAVPMGARLKPRGVTPTPQTQSQQTQTSQPQTDTSSIKTDTDSVDDLNESQQEGALQMLKIISPERYLAKHGPAGHKGEPVFSGKSGDNASSAAEVNDAKSESTKKPATSVESARNSTHDTAAKQKVTLVFFLSHEYENCYFSEDQKAESMSAFQKMWAASQQQAQS